MLSAQNIHKKYQTLEVLKGINFELKRGEMVSIVGASGAGKSTFLQILGTLDKPDEGEVFFEGTALHKLKDKDLAHFRNQKMGFVFQFHNLLPEFSALENVSLPALIGKKSKAEAEKRAIELLSLLGMESRAEHKPSELSGGEQQRVAVARALVNNPDIIFADEPSGNLDTKNAKDLHDLFVQLKTELKQTFVIVTHHIEFAQMADRQLLMQQGQIIQEIKA